MSTLNACDPKLECGRLLIVVATIVINIAAVSLLTVAPWSDWRTGTALNLIDNSLLIGLAVLKREALLARFKRIRRHLQLFQQHKPIRL